MNRTLLITVAALGCFIFMSGTKSALGEDRIVHENGFEDGWNDWQGDNPWEISRDEAHSGDFSAHCPVQAHLSRALVSPPMEIPADGWQTSFEFWVRCDARMPDSNGDFMLDDYFLVELNVNRGGWQDLLYDYGRDEQWQMDWNYYGPGVWWRDDMPEWRVMLDLSQFAGEEVQLRWRFINDGDMQGDQGTGLWIDDFRLISTDRHQNDVGMEWIRVKYPSTMGMGLPGMIKVTNFGTLDQERVQKILQIDHALRVPVVPWNALERLSSTFSNFNLAANRIINSGMTHIDAYTHIDEDEDISNDTADIDVMIYPENVWQLGYDDRRWSEVIRFDQGGPAVLFTPQEDRIAGEFDIYALDALWSNEQDGEARATLTLSRDNGGQPGEELYTDEITVTPGQVSPRRCYIDLAEIAEVKNLRGNFWASIVPQEEGGFPKILGRIPEEEDRNWGVGHYFNFDGNGVQEIGADFQLHAILTNGEINERNLVVQPVLYFGNIALNRPKTMQVTIMGGSTEPVTIEEIEINSELFRMDGLDDLPLELSVGETAQFDVRCDSDQEGAIEADLSFGCDDDSPPTVHITGSVGRFPFIGTDPEEIDFGEVEIEQFIEEELTISNAGDADLVITDISVEGENFDIEFNQELVVRSNSEETIFPNFAPLDTGRFEGRLIISSNDPYTPRFILPLRGVGISNGFPVVDRHISDQHIAEDFDSFVVADLDTIFRDIEGDELIFDAVSDAEGLLVNIDDGNRLWLSSELNWNGAAVITIFADDQIDDALQADGRPLPSIEGFYTIAGYQQVTKNHPLPSGQRYPHRDHLTEDAFNVAISPVNDPPEPFHLLTPEDGFVVERRHYSVDFSWEATGDVDGDALDYGLSFDVTYGNIDTVISYPSFGRNEVTVRLDEMLGSAGVFGIGRDSSLAVVWRVSVTDGVVSIESVGSRSVVITLPVSVQEQSHPGPIVFGLATPYPNPFNSSTTISYSLPRAGRYAVEVVDLNGRLVARLSYGWKEAGSYRCTWYTGQTASGAYRVVLRDDFNQSISPVTLVK